MDLDGFGNFITYVLFKVLKSGILLQFMNLLRVWSRGYGSTVTKKSEFVSPGNISYPWHPKKAVSFGFYITILFITSKVMSSFQ